ncbi:MAG: hypothetical protein AAF653_11695, partial [Chloroflexota bacterium]
MHFIYRGMLRAAIPGLFVLLAVSFMPVAQPAAAVSFTGANLTYDFNMFAGSGFAPAPAAGQLDSDDWRVTGLSAGSGTFGGTFTSGDFARGTSTGGISTGGVYAFEVSSGNTALGVQPTGSDFTPGAITLKVTNDTGSALTSIVVSYTVYFFNDQVRSNSFNLGYST